MKNTINSMTSTMGNIFQTPRSPLQPLPPPQLSIGSNLRPGIDAKLIASNIIRRQTDAGAFSGALPDGSANVMEAMYAIIIEEIVNALITNMRVDVVIPPGGLSLIANGGNAGGPVVSQGFNTNYALATGIIR